MKIFLSVRYVNPYVWLKLLKISHGNMLKTAMSHLAPVPNSSGLP